MKARIIQQITIIFLLICLRQFSFAKSPIKFGKITKEELTIKSCSIDSSAVAIVLYDYGELNPNTFQFCRTFRIKILRKEGLYLADQIFKGTDKQNIRGVTFNLVDGQIVEDKLSQESVFTEKVTDDIYRVKISMPKVKVGSVFDIEYFETGVPNTWKFQYEIPVMWSELYLPSSPEIGLRKSYSGYIPMSVATDDHWIAKKVPAFKEEPYISCPSNYIAKINVDLLKVNFPGHIKSYTTDWHAIARLLNDNEYFGHLLNNAPFLSDIEKTIRDSVKTKYEQMKYAYDTLKTIKWDGKLSLLANNNILRICYNNRNANSTEINLLLINLLRRLDIEAYPVILSTRENGYLPINAPSIEKLNNTIAVAYIDKKEYVLDASERLMPLGMLPERCINGYGQIIKNTLAFKIDLFSDFVDQKINIVNLVLKEDLSLTGNIVQEMKDYAAYDGRKLYESFNSKNELQKQLEDNYNGLKIKDYQIANLDEIYKPLTITMDVDLQDQVTEIGDEIYINPLGCFQMKENPFKNEDRAYPVDFAYLRNQVTSFEYTIPEGYSVVFIPETKVTALPENAARYIYQTRQDGNKIIINSMLTIYKETFFINDYPMLKQLFDIAVSKQKESIIIKKI